MVEQLYAERDRIKREPNTKANIAKLKKVQHSINHLLFYPEYVTIKIDKLSHYDYIFHNGLRINGVVYKRLSCSAGQARNSVVLLCSEDIIDEVKQKLNCERNLETPIAPSKLNAYFGLYSSATKVVREPKFCVVPDYNGKVKFKVNFVTETNEDIDDEIEIKEIEQEITRTDGMGLISPKLAKEWSEDLGLDYIPAQFVIRQAFLKGLVTVFDFHKFCEEKNNGNYLIKSVYKNENGENIIIDLRNIDLIVSESQFKLWNAYNGVEDYIEKFQRNGISWGIAQYAPETYDDVAFLNYQFIQSLELNKQDIKELCSMFEDWVRGVSKDNIDYTLLFLTGINGTPEKVKTYLQSWDIYWIKALVANRNVFSDKYIQEKIYKYISNAIKRACLGTIPVKGNFQYLVTDPYAYMQHLCGQEPNGLLQSGECYSHYWNDRNVERVNSMRAPLTHFSEHTPLNLVCNEETEKWYKWCKTGIIVNWHGYEVCKWAGADYDGDICLTTSNKTMLKGIRQNEYPVVYTPQKPQKIIPTEQDLQKFDKFGMGSIIGQITNRGASAYALLPLLKEKYGEDSKEYQTTLHRLKQGCKAQSCQIDKTKLGKAVKGIPKCWQTPLAEDNKFISVAENQHILLNKRPYFFKYLYKESKTEYTDYVKQQDFLCQKQFRKPLEMLLNSNNLSVEEQKFVEDYYEWCPLIISDSCMNYLCRYIESLDFDIKNKISTDNNFTDFELYKNPNVTYTEADKKKVLNILELYRKETDNKMVANWANIELGQEDLEDNNLQNIKLELTDYYSKIISNVDIIVNVLVDYFYKEKPKSDKAILWNNYGKEMVDNLLLRNTEGYVEFPMQDKNGNIEYLGKKFSKQKVELFDE